MQTRFGIIGLGVQGSLYAALLQGAPMQWGAVPQPAHCTLTAVSTRNETTLAPYRAAGLACYTDWRCLIDAHACDAVLITVPHRLHAEIALYAMEHGLDVLCDKPAALRASDAARMADTAHRTGRALGYLFNQRANPLHRQVAELLQGGALGRVRRSVWVADAWWRPDSYYRSAAWRGSWRGEGGGILVNQAPHQLDLWLWFCGMPQRIYACNREGAYRAIEVENDVTLVAEYPGGAVGVFTASTHNPAGVNRLEIECEGGTILLEDAAKLTVRRFVRPEAELNRTMTQRELETALRSDTGSLYAEETFTCKASFLTAYTTCMENFAAHRATGAPLLADAAAGLAEVQLANAAHLSGWQGRAVSCPCDPEIYDAALQQRIETSAEATEGGGLHGV